MEKVRTQKTTLGHNYSDIKKKIRTVKSIGGYDIRVLTLGHGAYNRHFNVLEETETYLLIKSGLVVYKIIRC